MNHYKNISVMYKKLQSIQKKEQGYLVVIAILVVVLVITLFFYRKAVNSTIGHFLSTYNLLNPSAALIDKRNLIVDFQGLRNSLRAKYENNKDYTIAIYFEYIPTGANITVNNDARIWPASLIKIPVAMAIVKKLEKGDWKPENELVILDEDKDSEFGNLYQEPTGTTLTIEETVRESIVNSDNTAHFMLLRNLESEELEDVYTHIGLDDVIDTLKKSPKAEELDNRITAKRYTIFFRSLYNATYLNPEYSQWFLNILREAPREYGSKGLPEDVLFVHKTGIRTDEKVWADSGIVYTPGRPYLVTVMIQKKSEGMPEVSEIESLFKEISEEIYNYVTKAY